MKKLVTLLLSLALVLSLAACGGEATPDASDDAPASSQNEESTENDNTENQIVFEEVVAIDNAECAVKITEIDPDNMWGYTLKAQLENKSTEKTYMFSVESASINGVQCDPMFASEVAAGKKANEEINFSTDTLEENGIVEYTDIRQSISPKIAETGASATLTVGTQIRLVIFWTGRNISVIPCWANPSVRTSRQSNAEPQRRKN